ncbi:MAG: hypothetical protein H0W78_13095 [Planctomycetes bacterium]|nr:hypothetical protein [Planctomycetota bacterium]
MITDTCAINIIQSFAFGGVRGATCEVRGALAQQTGLPWWCAGSKNSHLARRTSHGCPPDESIGGT